MWSFVNGSFIVGFFNSPPQVFVSEMVGDMPSQEHLFEAETAEEFQRLVSLPPSSLGESSSLAEHVSSLLSEAWPGSDDQSYQNLTSGGLMMIISGTGYLPDGTSSLNCRKLTFLQP